MSKTRFSYVMAFIFVLAFNLMGVAAQNKAYTVNDVPNVQIQDKNQYTTDPDGILTPEAKAQINQMILGLEQKTGAEVAVVTLPSIGDIECFDFSHELFNKWGIGKKGLDNGLLILLVTDQRCVQFYTGYGLEGILTDYTSKQIQMKDMVPYLKKGAWSQGMVAGVQAVYELLYDSMENGVVTKPTKNKGMGFPITLFFGAFFIIFILMGLAARKIKKCPKCGKSKLQRINSTTIQRTHNYDVIESTYKCLNCGHTLKRTNKAYKDNHRSGPGGGPIIGGGFGGGSFGGGSFGGGGFGGGGGGGGGAGTRF